ncbi:endonuclease/exonuclease/phosphatase family protein [Kineosporia sp. R_H_3]|uniref:endonuclease/exonuclease/phosphatase family protein n=1 Tax=Kineosporia sp. R_H_3 TaxID=1961848 RepID=UPI000B4B5A9F|nr:endonuclease/exonuclease/phosphatase family protein [Kineosporia sp. R_H_3]
MRILSLNAWGGAMFDDLAAWLPSAEADVLCLQEVTRSPTSGWTRFSDAERDLPQRADLFDDVRGLLPRHRGFFAASDCGPVDDADGTRHRQEFGIAAFVAPGTTVLEERSAFVHGAYVEHGQWPASGRPRVAHAMRLQAAAQVVTVVHLHGLRDTAGKGDTPDRARQADRIADLVVRTRRDGDLVVVCGDLNLLPGSATFATLADIGLVDLVGTADTRTSRYAKPLRHASYLLVSDPSAVERFEVVEAPEVSDHRALLLEV